MLAHNDADVISKIPRLEELPDLPQGVLSEIVRELIDLEEPMAMFDSALSP
ncbi:hypothetical protein [Phytohabitans houttuyneae]|uniref:FXSXX-COOH protein n=1 Tax=Phytohabitans houttuyneae TaxID=1076126 RepID=A0A6V8K7B0_9ACTN|nr:hypothetical protein [Phytohabitans houttuyneae]GFJ77627.1 hypothetical protein Phou_018070 [Phytohabitans houttuyneae]